MSKDFDPTMTEWQIEPSKIGNCLVRIVFLEISIAIETAKHNERVEAIRAYYETGKLTIDEYLTEVEQSSALIAWLHREHRNGSSELDALI